MKKIKLIPPKTKRKMINSKMAEIIRTLHKKGGAMSANAIAKATGFSYITVRKYLRELERHIIITEVMRKYAYAVEIAPNNIKSKKRSETKRYTLNYGLIYKNDRKIFHQI